MTVVLIKFTFIEWKAMFKLRMTILEDVLVFKAAMIRYCNCFCTLTGKALSGLCGFKLSSSQIDKFE